MYIHQKMQHASHARIQKMADLGIVKGLPKKIPKLSVPCPICMIAKATRLIRQPTVDMSNVPIGTRIQADFTFFNVESIRGFTSAFNVIESTVSYPFGFPSRSKRPPVSILKYIVSVLRSFGFSVKIIRLDEGGELAKSADFMQTVYDLNMIPEFTGGYASTINGKVERPNRTLKNMVRSQLFARGFPDKFWCFAYQYSIWCLRRLFNRHVGTAPIIPWHKGKYTINLSEMLIWGCKVYVINSKDQKKSLDPRTARDPREVTVPVDPMQLPQQADGYFMSYANTTKVLLYYDPSTNKVKRAHHAYVDEFDVRISPDEKHTPGALLLSEYPAGEYNPRLVDPSTVRMVKPTLDLTNSPFDPDKLITVEIELPPAGHPLYISIQDDTLFNIPFIERVYSESPLYAQIPANARRNAWIVSIDSEEPIMAATAIKELQRRQLSESTNKISLILTRRRPGKPTNYESLRAAFDQIRPVIAHSAYFNERPPTPSDVGKALKGPHRHHWIQGLFAQYDKNAKVHLFTKPIPVSSIPPEKKVLKSVISLKVKPDGKNMWKFAPRHCANGAPQLQGIDFDESYAPVAGACPVRTQLAISASWNLIVGVIDVTNAFQNTILPPHKREYVTLPPYYLEWFKRRHPLITVDETKGRLCIQACNGMQGTKPAGRNWNQALHAVLTTFGLQNVPAEQALYVLHTSDYLLIVSVSTDDLLCSYSSVDVFHRLYKHLCKCFPCTKEEGALIRFLNLRIIQSPHGISFDQTEHIKQTIVDRWFPNQTSPVGQTDTPFRTDSAYETELAEALPLEGPELLQMEKEYNGKYSATVGQYNHIEQWSRPDTSYSTTRYASYAAFPTRPAFHGLKRQAKYFACNLHRPIVYPRGASLDGTTKLKYDFGNGEFEEKIILNNLEMFPDANHARGVDDRRSITSIIFTLLGVAIHWKVNKQPALAVHSTDAEIRAFYLGTKLAEYIRQILEHMGVQMTKPIRGLEDSQPTIDIIKANRVTSRVKHIAVPVAYIHEKYDAKLVTPEHIKTTIQPADMSTKPVSGPVLQRHFKFIRGYRFYPPKGSEHYTLLQLDLAD